MTIAAFARGMLVAAVCTVGATLREANATVVYGGQAAATLSVMAISGGPAPAGDLLFASQASDSMDTFTFGSGIAFASAAAIGDDANRQWEVGATVFGEAGPASGFAFSDTLASIMIQIANTSLTSTLQILFELDYIVNMGGSVTDPTTDSSIAASKLMLGSAASGALVDLEVLFNTQAGEPGGNVSEAFQFSVVLGPGEIDSLSMVADVEGSALTVPIAVPEPAMFTLFGTGLL